MASQRTMSRLAKIAKMTIKFGKTFGWSDILTGHSGITNSKVVYKRRRKKEKRKLDVFDAFYFS